MIPWGHHAPDPVTGGLQQGRRPPAGEQFNDLSRSIIFFSCFFLMLVASFNGLYYSITHYNVCSNDNQHHLWMHTFSIFLSISPCPAALLTFIEDSPPTGLSFCTSILSLDLCAYTSPTRACQHSSASWFDLFWHPDMKIKWRKNWLRQDSNHGPHPRSKELDDDLDRSTTINKRLT